MSSFEKWSVWVTSALTGITGVAYFWAKYMVEPSDPFAVVNHPLQPWFLKSHILVSPLLLLAVGSILVRHVWKHYRRGIRWGRRSGITTALVFLPMVLTGYAIQAVTHAGWLQALAVGHIAVGAVYLVGLGLHQVAVQYLRPRRRRAGKTDDGGVGTEPRERAPRASSSVSRSDPARADRDAA